MADYKILLFNPGSTSMKIGLYCNEEQIFSKNVDIPLEKIKKFASLYDQYLYRKDLVKDLVEKNGHKMEDVDVFLARAGGMSSCPAGIYEVNDILLKMNDLTRSSSTAQMMGCRFVTDCAAEFGGKGYVINDSAVDEFIDEARVTGMRGVWRETHCHALNQKKAAAMAAERLGKEYDEVNLVVAHLGGGVSIGAHRKGKIIDTTTVLGEGPMSPTRTGSLPLGTVCMAMLAQKLDAKTLMKLSLAGGGGLTAHLGTADCIEVEKMIADGNEYAELIYNGMLYQFGQNIAKMAASLEGKVDAIVLTGGLSYSKIVQAAIEKYCGWIAPIEVLAGEYETEAMVEQMMAVLTGRDTSKEYTGIPLFDPKKFDL